jgi:hypothetical protein
MTLKKSKQKFKHHLVGANTEYTVKTRSESFPTFSFVWCPYLTMVVCGHFNNTDLLNQGQTWERICSYKSKITLQNV